MLLKESGNGKQIDELMRTAFFKDITFADLDCFLDASKQFKDALNAKENDSKFQFSFKASVDKTYSQGIQSYFNTIFNYMNSITEMSSLFPKPQQCSGLETKLIYYFVQRTKH